MDIENLKAPATAIKVAANAPKAQIGVCPALPEGYNGLSVHWAGRLAALAGGGCSFKLPKGFAATRWAITVADNTLVADNTVAVLTSGTVSGVAFSGAVSGPTTSTSSTSAADATDGLVAQGVLSAAAVADDSGVVNLVLSGTATSGGDALVTATVWGDVVAPEKMY